ncbi:COQ9 family protein [Novosphingobium sp.]|uniref:COQ9 family protein n=1 Tax=Novosphingobium sp. TaxID=1874826 RepID=UPI00333FC402
MTDSTDHDSFRIDLAPLIADAASFDGWTDAAVTAAAEIAGVDPAAARFAFDGKAMAMITAWTQSIDAQMLQMPGAATLTSLKIRDRIRTMIEFRLEAIAGREEALRRALIELAKPGNLVASAQLGWKSADVMWRMAGDTATDLNHYSKRATLAAIYAATLAVMADDRSEDHADTRAFLGRRIDGVMRFEKFKAQVLNPKGERPSLVRLFGRLRYPAT